MTLSGCAEVWGIASMNSTASIAAREALFQNGRCVADRHRPTNEGRRGAVRRWRTADVAESGACPVQAQVLGTGVLPVTEVGPNLFQLDRHGSAIHADGGSPPRKPRPIPSSISRLRTNCDLAGAVATVCRSWGTSSKQVEGLSNDVHSLQVQIASPVWPGGPARVHLGPPGAPGGDSATALAVLQLRHARSKR